MHYGTWTKAITHSVIVVAIGFGLLYTITPEARGVNQVQTPTLETEKQKNRELYEALLKNSSGKKN